MTSQDANVLTHKNESTNKCKTTQVVPQHATKGSNLSVVGCGSETPSANCARIAIDAATTDKVRALRAMVGATEEEEEETGGVPSSPKSKRKGLVKRGFVLFVFFALLSHIFLSLMAGHMRLLQDDDKFQPLQLVFIPSTFLFTVCGTFTHACWHNCECEFQAQSQTKHTHTCTVRM